MQGFRANSCSEYKSYHTYKQDWIDHNNNIFKRKTWLYKEESQFDQDWI